MCSSLRVSYSFNRRADASSSRTLERRLVSFLADVHPCTPDSIVHSTFRPICPRALMAKIPPAPHIAKWLLLGPGYMKIKKYPGNRKTLPAENLPEGTDGLLRPP